MSRPTSVAEAPLSFGLFTLARALNSYGSELLLDIGLHPGQELVLMRLYDRDGQTQSELQRALGLDHSTVSRTIRRMQEAGLLEREPDPDDRRVMVVSLTPKGKTMRDPVIKVWLALDQVVARGVDEPRRAEFLAVVEAVERALVVDRRDKQGRRSGDY
jgi:DNA-binding MarR family transcriptional regulator